MVCHELLAVTGVQVVTAEGEAVNCYGEEGDMFEEECWSYFVISLFQIEMSKVPQVFLKWAKKTKPCKEKEKLDFLCSISAVVTKKEESDVLAEYDVSDRLISSGEEDTSEDDSDIESDMDDEEYQCVVCGLNFVGEDEFEQHRRISQHWG